jgi:hypothetical protein
MAKVSLMETMRNALKFVLMSMGISSPEKKPAKDKPPVSRKD